MIKVKVENNTGKYWQWCCDNLNIGDWKMMVGFMGHSGTFVFEKAEDATLFKLVFGL